MTHRRRPTDNEVDAYSDRERQAEGSEYERIRESLWLAAIRRADEEEFGPTTGWVPAEPQDGLAGRVVLRADPSVTLPVVLETVGFVAMYVTVSGVLHRLLLERDDWDFQVAFTVSERPGA
jgi:hypothetical protein